MRVFSDGFDLLISVIALLLMLTVCAWCIDSLKDTMEVAVDEKMVSHNLVGTEVVKPVQTAKDALMSLVVNDAYVPDPITVVFKYGNSSYTVKFNDAWFADKEASINTAWSSFFYNKMNTKVESVTLNSSGTYWTVKLVS